MYKFLKVVEIGDLKESKTNKGQQYRTLKLRPITVLPNGSQVFNNEPERSRTIFGEFEDFKADPLFTRIQAGELKRGGDVEGEVRHFQTTEYKPEGFERSITSYTCVVFSNEDPVKYANRQLKNNYACVIDMETGALTAEKQLEKPTTAETVRA